MFVEVSKIVTTPLACSVYWPYHRRYMLSMAALRLLLPVISFCFPGFFLFLLSTGPECNVHAMGRKETSLDAWMVQD